MDEIIEGRGACHKTYSLGGKDRQLFISFGALHYKDDYADLQERWKDIDLRWDGRRLDTAPYILDVKGNAISFVNKKTADRAVLSPGRLGTGKAGKLSDFVINPTRQGVKLQYIITEADYSLHGPAALTNQFNLDSLKGNSILAYGAARDADGEELSVQVKIEKGQMIETVDPRVHVSDEVITDEEGNIVEVKPIYRDARFPITIDPVLELQPASYKDSWLHSSSPNTVQGYGTQLELMTIAAYRPILAVNTTPIPRGVTLNSATLSLYYASFAGADPAGQGTRMYRMPNKEFDRLTKDWVRTQATWNSWRTGDLWATAGGDYRTDEIYTAQVNVPAAPGVWMNWDVLRATWDAIKRRGYDMNLLLRFLTEGGSTRRANFWSSRYTTDPTLVPKMVVNYDAADGQYWTGVDFMSPHWIRARSHGIVTKWHSGTLSSYHLQHTMGRNLCMVGDYLYATSSTPQLLVVFDCRNVDAPVEVARLNTGNANLDIRANPDPNYVHISTWTAASGRLLTIDISNPAAPFIAHNLNIGEGQHGMFVLGNYLYICGHDHHRLRIYDVSNPLAPALQSTLTDANNLRGVHDVHVEGDYAYVGNYLAGAGQPGFTVVDVTDKAAPFVAASGALNRQRSHIIKGGNYVYIGAHSPDSNMLVFDVTDPLLPVQVFDGPPQFYWSAWWTVGTLLWANDILIDVSNPAAPVMVGRLGPERGAGWTCVLVAKDRIWDVTWHYNSANGRAWQVWSYAFETAWRPAYTVRRWDAAAGTWRSFAWDTRIGAGY